MGEASKDRGLGCSGLSPCEWLEIPGGETLGGEGDTDEVRVVLVGIPEGSE
jgi:hypothetical protein